MTDEAETSQPAPIAPMLVVPPSAPPAPAAPAPFAGTQEQAAARVAELKGSAAYRSRFSSSDPAEREAAQKEMSSALAAAFPGELDENLETVDSQAAPVTLAEKYDIAFEKSATVEQQAQSHAMVQSMGLALGLDRATTNAAAREISTATLARGNAPMSPAELGQFETALQGAWREDYDANAARVEAAIKKLGPDRAAAFRKSLLSAGPRTCTWVFLTLANQSRA